MKKKNKKLGWILLVVLLVALIFIFRNSKTEEETKVNIEPVVQEVEGLVIADSFEAKTMVMNDAYVKFDVKYPYFKKADQNFNSQIEQLIKDKANENKKISSENWQGHYDNQLEGENFPKVPTKEEDKYEFDSNFRIIQSNSSYISCIIDYGGYSGGAHGYENQVSFNYDVKNQKILTLKEMFTNGFDYLNYLSLKSRESLKVKYATVSNDDRSGFESEDAIKEYEKNLMSSINLGTEPKEENFSVFTFTTDKVKIYFAQYQVGPYVIGMPEVEINRK